MLFSLLTTTVYLTKLSIGAHSSHLVNLLSRRGFCHWDSMDRQEPNLAHRLFLHSLQNKIGFHIFEWLEKNKKDNIFNWNIIALQCVSFCCTMKWISYKYTYIPSLLSFTAPHPLPVPPFRVITEHWAGLPVFYSRLPLAFCFTPDSVARTWKPPKCPTMNVHLCFVFFFSFNPENADTVPILWDYIKHQMSSCLVDVDGWGCGGVSLSQTWEEMPVLGPDLTRSLICFFRTSAHLR